MKNPNMVKNLVDFGLSENEAKVYISALSLGPTTALQIAKNAEMNRTTVYPIVESLKSKGLMGTEVKGFKQFFFAENPSRLEGVLESKKDKLRETVPELTALYNLKGGQSLIKYYEGVNGMKTVYESMLEELRPGDFYYVISDMEQALKTDSEFFSKFIEKRGKLRLKIRALFQDSKAAQYYKSIERNDNWEIRILPKDTNLVANSVIIPHKVVVTQTTPPVMCLTIENQSIVQIQKAQFEIIWKSLDKDYPTEGKTALI